jgi:iron only hydrogenase large subunit-like protein
LNDEELGALFVAQNIELTDCKAEEFDTESSKEGRGFGVTGGVAAAVASLCEIEVKPCIINGLNKETIRQLTKMAKEGCCEGCNLVEVMCCENGCIGGSATIAPEKVSQKALREFLNV